jgi:Galactose oxidase-like, Early set domain/Glyoxal oxidase N-terminus
MNRFRCGSHLAVLVIAFALNANAQTVPAGTTAAPGPVADAQTKGVFGALVTWPLNAIHAVLLPDGRVMSYGTDQQGQQGGQYVYDVWNPALGTGTEAHLVLPNMTPTDIFCSGQSVFSTSGEVLITGGDLTINGKRNFSNQQTTVFQPQTNTITAAEPMLYARWYPSIVSLPDGDKLILGGRQDKPDVAVPTPEVYRQGTGWRTLWGATSDAAFGAVAQNWYYPRGFVAPNGKVFVLSNDGTMFYLDPTGNGTISQLAQKTLSGLQRLPTLMFAPGKILAVRNQRKVMVVDLNGLQPQITPTADISQLRIWSNTKVLADGKVLLTGGSAVANTLVGVAYAAEIWDPTTGQWTLGARAVRPRLYHSIALLLPDGSVLTAGGGAPGPVKNLNAEIYYPPYLFGAFGQPAARPSLVNAPGLLQLHLNQQFAVTMGTAEPISRVTLARTGSVTHAFDPDQRFLPLGFTQAGQTLTITLPTIDPNVVVPGYYMLFVFNQAGVPSVARIVKFVA